MRVERSRVIDRGCLSKRASLVQSIDRCLNECLPVVREAPYRGVEEIALDVTDHAALGRCIRVRDRYRYVPTRIENVVLAKQGARGERIKASNRLGRPAVPDEIVTPMLFLSGPASRYPIRQTVYVNDGCYTP